MSDINLKLQRNQELALIIKNSHDKPNLRNEYNTACEEFLKNYSALFNNFTKRYNTNNRKAIYEDLIITFQQAAINACTTYDEAKGSNITTYLYYALKNAVHDFQSEDAYIHGNIPNSTYSKLYKAYLKLEEKDGTALTAEELAKFAGCSVKIASGYLALRNVKHLNEPINANDGKTELADVIPEKVTPEMLAMENETAENLKIALSFLPGESAKIIYMKFYKELKQEQIAEILNKSNQLVSIKINNAIKNLKVLFEPENLMAIKQIVKLRQKHKKMISYNTPSTLENLLYHEHISQNQLFKMYRVAKYYHNKRACVLNNENFESCNLLLLDNFEKNVLKDILVMEDTKKLYEKYSRCNSNPFTIIDNQINYTLKLKEDSVKLKNFK